MDYLNKTLQSLPLSDKEKIKLRSYAAVCFALVEQMGTMFDDECSNVKLASTIDPLSPPTVELNYADEDVDIQSTPAATTVPVPSTTTATIVTPIAQPIFTSRRTKVVVGELIMFEEDAFKYMKDGMTPWSTSSKSQSKTQSTTVNKIISIIKSPATSEKQQVVALCVASMYPKVCHIQICRPC